MSSYDDCHNYSKIEKTIAHICNCEYEHFLNRK